MSTLIHLSLDIKGSLRNPGILKGVITYNGKKLNTEKEIKDFLQYQLSLGRKFLPMGDCDNFDYQTGCMGHEEREDNA